MKSHDVRKKFSFWKIKENKVCQCLATGLWFSLGTPVSSTNKTDCHDITEILLNVALNTIILTLHLEYLFREYLEEKRLGLQTS
jgi:hypothetical protein